MKNLSLALILLVLISSCQSKTKKEMPEQSSKDLKQLFDNYYEERLKYFPLEATAIADKRYNDQLPIDISDSYRDTLKNFYQKYLDAISKYDRNTLTGQDILSYDIFKREME